MDDIDRLAYRFWSIHPKDIPEPAGMPDGYPGGARAWFYASEMRSRLEAQAALIAEAREAIDGLMNVLADWPEAWGCAEIQAAEATRAKLDNA